MLSNITLGQYFPGDSFIHRLDPRTKILLTLVMIVMVFLASSFLAYGLLAVFFFALVLVARLRVLSLLRSIKPLWPIITITLLIHMFSGQGTVLYEWSVLSITREGLQQGLLMVLRLVFLILLSSVLTMTTSPLALTDGLEILLNPFKRFGLPAHELSMMMTIALRFIPTLLNETERIMKAQTARGADFKGGSLVKRAKNMLSLVIPLFVSAFRRADELATAMEARCYRGGEGRTRMNELVFGSIDIWAVAGVFCLSAAMAYVKWGGLCDGLSLL